MDSDLRNLQKVPAGNVTPGREAFSVNFEAVDEDFAIICSNHPPIFERMMKTIRDAFTAAGAAAKESQAEENQLKQFLKEEQHTQG